MRTLITVFTLLGLIAPAVNAQEIHNRQYDIRTLETEVAEGVVFEICASAGKECAVLSVGPSKMAVRADLEIHPRIATKLAQAKRTPTAQVFQITLLEAKDEGMGLQGVADSIQDALSTARSLLPYDSYGLVGTSLVRTDGDGHTLVPGSSEAGFDAQISFRNAFTSRGHRLMIRRFRLSQLPPRLESGRYEEGAAALDLLETSFAMSPGETVVVGTSQPEGAQNPLLVLLTALPSSPSDEG